MYQDKVPVKPPIREVPITINWIDGYGETGKKFDTVEQFASFLKQNPEIAKAVGYLPKIKN
jgi:hypothetical protein